MPSKSEIDPLLPQNPPAPEITGHGFSSPKRSNADEVGYDYAPTSNYNLDVDHRDLTSGDSTGIYDESNDSKRYGTIIGSAEGVPAENGEDNQGPNEQSDSAVANAALRQIISIFTFVIGIALILVLIVPGGLRIGEGWGNEPDPVPVPDHPSSAIQARVEKILKETPLFDGHNDLAIFLRAHYSNKIHTPEFKDKFEKGGMESHVDIPRLQKGMVGGGFWSAFVLCPANASYDFTDATYSTAVSETLSQIDLLHRLQSQYPSTFIPATTPLENALSSFHANHTILSPLSIEGLHQIPPSAPLSTIRLYYTLGVRAATLTWNCHNAFAAASLITDVDPNNPGKLYTFIPPPSPHHPRGLTLAGRELLHEMNRLGMLIDLSHTSHLTQNTVLSNPLISRAPIIYTHSSAYKLCPHPRNVQDSNLDLVRKTNSLVMVNFSPDFISCVPPASGDPSDLPEFYPANNTIHQVARHITYIGERIGYDHVGLGSDFDGTYPSSPSSSPLTNPP